MDDDKLHREMLEDALKDKDDNGRFSKLFRILVGIFVVFVIISVVITFLGGGRFIDFLEGRIVSSTIDKDYNIILNDGSEIIIGKENYDGLRELFLENQRYEFKVCLLGYKDENYIITGLYVPKIYSRTVFSVTSEFCNDETIVSMHSHPPDRCVFSSQDIISYNEFKNISPNAIIGLMCNTNRFTFYSG